MDRLAEAEITNSHEQAYVIPAEKFQDKLIEHRLSRFLSDNPAMS